MLRVEACPPLVAGLGEMDSSVAVVAVWYPFRLPIGILFVPVSRVAGQVGTSFPRLD